MDGITLISSDESIAESLPYFITRLPYFFKRNGFAVRENFPEDFFALYNHMPLDDVLSRDTLESWGDVICGMVCTSPEEYFAFPKLYSQYVEQRDSAIVPDELAQRLKNSISGMKHSQKEIESLDKAIREETANLQNIRKEKQGDRDPLISEAAIKKYKTLEKAAGASYKSILGKQNNTFVLVNLLPIAMREQDLPTMAEIKAAKDTLKKMAVAAMMSSNCQKILEFITYQSSVLDKISEHVKKTTSLTEDMTEAHLQYLKQQMEHAKREMETAGERLEKIKRNLTDDETLITKRVSQNHRELFLRQNNRAVQTLETGIKELDKDFESITSQDAATIEMYIAENAQKFKTRMLRNIRSSQKRRVDMAETIKKACGTDGIPIRLQNIKKKKSKANITMILDISGSCREASRMMLTFMSKMQDVFPGGCRAYVFVDTLNDITDIFREADDTDAAMDDVMQAVPTRGVYSNYYVPLRTFYEEHMREITKDSIVIFIGDARNNRNDNGEEYIKEIARKAKSAYWLNTEKVNEWDVGDSIIGTYAPYMRRVFQTTTTAELLGFLLEAK